MVKDRPKGQRAAIKRIKKLLRDQPSDLCLFTPGINTAFRVNELLSIKVDQVQSLSVGDVLVVKQVENGQVPSGDAQQDGG